MKTTTLINTLIWTMKRKDQFQKSGDEKTARRLSAQAVVLNEELLNRINPRQTADV